MPSTIRAEGWLRSGIPRDITYYYFNGLVLGRLAKKDMGWLTILQSFLQK